MKRVLSLVLVLVLALGSVPFAFAEDAAVMTAGETLKGYGLAKGVDAEGNLNEEGMLTRAEMMVMLSRLLGVEEEAMNYAIPSTSKDVEGHWAAKYIAYAEQVGKWTSGVGENMFGSDDKVTTQMVAKFMLTALGHEANWDTAVADATALGLMKGVTAEATADITRGQVFAASLNTIETPKKDSEVKLGVTLGVIKEEAPVVAALAGTVDSVKAVANNLVEVNFEDAVAADAAAVVANYGITERANTANVVVINSVVVEDEDTILIETAALKAGTAYTLTVVETANNFSGIAKVTTAPVVDTVKGTDTGVVTVTFEKMVDAATAEDIANYVINKEGTVVKAELSDDRLSVDLTVEGLTTTSAKILTVENVLSIDKVVMKKVTKTFYAKFDKYAPTIAEVKNAKNDVEFTVYFKDDHGVDKATAEDVANYSVEGLEILSATATKYKYDDSATDDEAESDFYQKVVLTTSGQTYNKLYTIKVSNMMDGSNAKNVIAKDLSDTFRGGKADTTAPSFSSVDAKTNTTIEVKFSDNNDLDPATALDTSNYSIDKDEVTILEAKFKDGETDSKYVVLTTTPQPEKKTTIKLTVSGIADVFNNTMSSSKTLSTVTAIEDLDAPIVKSVTPTTDETIVVEFDGDMDKVSAEDPTNYSINESIGAPTKAVFKSNSEDKVILTIPGLTGSKTYEVTVTNVSDLSGNVIESTTSEFIALRSGIDNENPTVSDIVVTNEREVRVTFSEEFNITTSPSIITATGGSTEYKFKSVESLPDDLTVVYKISSSATSATLDDLEFEISEISNIQDKATNNLELEAGDEIFVFGENSDVDDLDVVDGSQTDVKTFKFYFNREVKVVTSSMTGMDLERDEDDFTLVIGTADTYKFAEDEEFNIDFADFVTDLLGNVAKSDSNEYIADLIDEVEPSIVEIKAIDNKTIHVTYDEEIHEDYVGTYTLHEGTESDEFDGVDAAIDADDATIVVVTLDSEELDGEKYYTLKQVVEAKDLAKVRAIEVDGGVEFVGNGTAAADDYIIGADIVNGTTVTVKRTADFTAGDDVDVTQTGTDPTVLDAGNVTSDTVSEASTSVEVQVNDFTPFMKDVDYTVEIGTESFTFAGIVTELDNETATGTTITGGVTSTSSVTVALDGFDHEDYYTYAADSTITTSSVTIDEDGSLTLDVEATGSAALTAASVQVVVKNGNNVIYITKVIPLSGLN